MPNLAIRRRRHQLQPKTLYLRYSQNIMSRESSVYTLTKLLTGRPRDRGWFPGRDRVQTGPLPFYVYCGLLWSLTLREERKLRVFENMVLRRIFGPRKDEVTGEWRRLHNEELNDLYSSPNIVRVIK